MRRKQFWERLFKSFKSFEQNFQKKVDEPDKMRYTVYCYYHEQRNSVTYSKGGNKMSEIRVKEGESLESALRRFKRSTARSGVLAEVRKREAYEKPSVKRKKKSEAARKRKFK